ncbi:MAG: hypothetical protein V4674_03285 [Patescibacteria group bacterium]
MTIKTKIAASSLCASVLLLSGAMPAFAQTDINATVGVTAEVGTNKADAKAKVDATRMDKVRTRANQEIDRRVSALTKLKTRIGEMKRITAEQKAGLSATVQAQIDSLAALKVKIAADTTIELLKTDAQSITNSYRIYALIMPQITILAAADRANELAGQFVDLKAKLDVRIAEAKNAGKDVTAVMKLRTDMDVKLADAKVQSDAAVSLVASLKPDNGDKAKMEANHKALMDARAKIRTSNESLKAARKLGNEIVRAIKAMKINASGNASTTVTQ